MAEKFVVYSEEQLENMFESQMTALERHGVAGSFLFRLRCRKSEVLAEAKDTAFHDGHLPFAPKLAADGSVGFIYDVPPPPAGFLPDGRVQTAIATRHPATAVLSEIPASFPPAVARLIGGPGPLSVRSQQAVQAYVRCSPDIPPPGSIIDIYV